MFETVITPRFGDMDGLRHINNCLIPVWFENARTPIFRIFNPSMKVDFENWNLIMARIEADFLDEMHWGEDVRIVTHVVKIGSSSFTVGQEAWQKGRLCAMGTAVHVHYNFSTGSSVRIPADVRKQLDAHLLDFDEWSRKRKH
jgi:acyl-CoA thioester hydrolase